MTSDDSSMILREQVKAAVVPMIDALIRLGLVEIDPASRAPFRTVYASAEPVNEAAPAPTYHPFSLHFTDGPMVTYEATEATIAELTNDFTSDDKTAGAYPVRIVTEWVADRPHKYQHRQLAIQFENILYIG